MLKGIWYEVDVPQSYIDGTAEMLFKNGGMLNLMSTIRRKSKNFLS